VCPSSKLPSNTYRRGQDTVPLFDEASVATWPARLLLILVRRLLRLIVGPGARTQEGREEKRCSGTGERKSEIGIIEVSTRLGCKRYLSPSVCQFLFSLSFLPLMRENLNHGPLQAAAALSLYAAGLFACLYVSNLITRVRGGNFNITLNELASLLNVVLILPFFFHYQTTLLRLIHY
jgi:hypothetical protein